jgi:FkbM family methyltransferase
MMLVSYSQNHEDILLWRALKHIENGFYIDVGASDSQEDSVTYLFYERGWNGINIEPSSQAYKSLCKERDRDINLCCAAGSYEGKMSFYDVPTRGWSTSDPETGQYYLNNQNAVIREVEVFRLDSIIKKCNVNTIHFLKIDVEGAELDVLNGLDLKIFRPWILIIESLSPINRNPSHQLWESKITENDYKFVYSDGLNRFYLANECYVELKEHFAYPPNVLDEFLPSSTIHWLTESQKLQVQVDALQLQTQDLESQAKRFANEAQHFKSQANRFENEAQRFKSQANYFENEANVFRQSRSWQITAPLRKAGKLARAIKKQLRVLRDKLRQPRKLAKLVYRKLTKINISSYSSHFKKIRKPDLEYDFQNDTCLHNNLNIRTIILPLPAGKRIIYLFVDHTIQCSTNTGVQRVTRALANSLSFCGESVRYIKWDSHSRQALLINLSERKYLANWNGPALTETDLQVYLPSNEPPTYVEPKLDGENHWLIVPEVTHITFQEYPVTLDLIMWARKSHIKVGFIFYDAIPLQRPEFANMAVKHMTYMQQLLLTDVVWSISQSAGQDLLAYWKYQESADNVTMPEVMPVLLSGESILCDRVKTPTESESLILSVGTIEPRKNQVSLIQCFDSYCKEFPNTEWRLALVGNLHPDVADAVNSYLRSNSKISHLGHVSDEQLDALYRNCSFTVFPSVSEGFGLPILESLWYGKPCICANFGSMAEVAEDGGCLTVNTRDQSSLQNVLTRLIENTSLRQELSQQAVSRPIRSWNEYTSLIIDTINKSADPRQSLGTIYYWIESTIKFPKNTGIQRVSRQLARGLMEAGFKLIPVQWDSLSKQIVSVSFEDLLFFSQWNGPLVEMWTEWRSPSSSDRSGNWFFMAELPLNLATFERQLLLGHARSLNLNCAAVFYDAIPWVMRDIYPVHFAQAHYEYMLELNDYDLVFPISHYSQDDLINFLGEYLTKPQSLENKITAVPLPGEFTESERYYQISTKNSDKVNILCIGTVEPRKNHEKLLEAFVLASSRVKTQLELVIVGGSHSIEPQLADRVRNFIANHSDIKWEENADDSLLRELHLSCDFTVYPSLREGFGLPILESLWYAKPCICANFGSMAEVATGGGCLTVDVRNVEDLARAIQNLAENKQLYHSLVEESVNRPFKSWKNYANEIAILLAQKTPKQKMVTGILSQESTKSFNERIYSMNLPKRPLLSVCISTYNRAEWLATSLKNWQRLYPNALPEVEFLVCDNASTDHTSNVVQPYLERSDFSYYRNNFNVGMLGNLRQTTHYAKGQYVWILGDDDLLMPNAIETILDKLYAYLKVSLVYLNYAFTRIEDARTISNFDKFFQEATPIVNAESDLFGAIKTICARNENFFTAIYTLVLRRDHAIKAYSQDTSGRPFSTMLTCIPTTYYVLNNMMDEMGVWLGTPQVVVNMNVSWMRYAPIWILERIPEVYEEAELRGVSPEETDRWRCHTLPGVIHYFGEIFKEEQLNNSECFDPKRLIRRFKHLPVFQEKLPELIKIYSLAYENRHPKAVYPLSQIFPAPNIN